MEETIPGDIHLFGSPPPPTTTPLPSTPMDVDSCPNQAQPNASEMPSATTSHDGSEVTPPLEAAEAPIEVGNGPQKRKPNENPEDFVFLTTSQPPLVLTDGAIKSRIRRIFLKRKDGTMQLDDQWNTMWGDVAGGGRQKLMSMFEKCGYDVERVAKFDCYQNLF